VGTVQIESYQDFLDVLEKEDLSDFETFVIDTGGKCLDYMADYIIRKNPKLGKSNGTLTLQGYGERKAEFSALCKRISLMNKHILFVAHRETRTDGDEVRYVPLFGGSNYDSLVTELDLVGYLEANGRKRVITFDPTSRNDGKNTCNLPSTMDIPVIVDESGNPTGNNNFFFERIIQPYIKRLESRKVEGIQYNEVIENIKEQVEQITDELSANDFVQRIDHIKHIGTSRLMAAKLVRERCTQLGLKFNSKAKVYERS